MSNKMRVPGGWVRRWLSGAGKASSAKSRDGHDIEVVARCEWAAAGSHIGRVREQNEDSFLYAPERGLFIVADGLGGHSGGEQASAAAIAFLDAALSAGRIAEACAGPMRAVEELLGTALSDAHQAVLATAEERPELAGMGSTAAVTLLHGGTLAVANTGDSRIYLVRDGSVQLLSQDHSMAAVLFAQGQLTADEARSPRFRNQLTQCLGSARDLDPARGRIEIQPGDHVVLCSDGLWEPVPDREIGRVSNDEADPADAVRRLIRAANAAGGSDNITVIVLSIGEEALSLALQTNPDEGCPNLEDGAEEAPSPMDTVPAL